MKPQTITTIERLEPGDWFTKKEGGYVYEIVEKKIIRKNKKIYAGTCRRVDQSKLMMYRQNLQVVFLGKRKTVAA